MSQFPLLRLRRAGGLDELGFAIDEVEVVPSDGGSAVRLRVTTSNRAFHAHELERLTGILALEGQATMLLNDLREHKWLLSERAKRDVGLDASIDAYLAEGAPAPELPAPDPPVETPED